MLTIIKNKNTVLLEERPIPKVNTDSVLIKIAMAGLCRTDIYAAQGYIKTKDPIILGHEFCGTIEHLGNNVKKFHLGDFVTVMPVIMQNQYFAMLGVDIDGAFAEYIAVPASHVYPVPTHLSLQEAAYMEPIAASLAVIKAPIQPEHHGLIYGDNRIAELTQRILELHGFKHIQLCSSAEQLPTNTFDFIVETNPSDDAFLAIVQALKTNGLLILKSRYKSAQLPLHSIVQKEIKMVGVHYGDFQESIDLVADGKLPIQDLLGSTYSLSAAVDILQGKQPITENKKIFFKPDLG